MQHQKLYPDYKFKPKRKAEKLKQRKEREREKQEARRLREEEKQAGSAYIFHLRLTRTNFE